MARTVADYSEQELRNYIQNVVNKGMQDDPRHADRFLAAKQELASREKKKGGRGPNWYLLIDVRDGDEIGVGPGPEQVMTRAKWVDGHVKLDYKGRHYSLYGLKEHLGVPLHSKSTINGKYLDDLASGAMRED